ncbi:C-X-C motif chemokine 6-like [Melanotaenia boesemani]|uniref:C-X-C motif chemokine 6-like n=1 Tax=Melanotaenia boesemani TaxID=1250792 RepID=UPI001C042E99|nr:C-X-C motif chemokine 6-like [Melanotaenia boesemani]
MSIIIKGFLLLAIVVCISYAQVNEAGQQCLCQRVRNRMEKRSEIKDIQIYQATVFCTKVEIVVTNNNGLRYCLNPDLKAVKMIVTNILKNKKIAATTSTGLTSSTST